MPLSRDSRTERKLKAIRRAEFRLKQTLEYIDWSESVLYPEIEALKAGRAVLGLEAGAVFDIQVADAHSTHSDTPARDTSAGHGAPRHKPARRRAKSSRAGARLRSRK